MIGFFVVVILLGWVFSLYFGSPIILYIAVGIAIIMNVFSYWNSDKIVIKMGLHEVSLAQHLQILKEFNRILKLTGKIIVWDIMLNDNTQSLFQDIIREKDRLAGYDLLTTERYFFRENEFLKNTEEAGFTKVTEFHKISYRFSSKRRLESELKNDISKLKELNEFIRIRFPQNLKQLMNYEEKGDDIQFTITKKIYVLQK